MELRGELEEVGEETEKASRNEGENGRAKENCTA